MERIEAVKRLMCFRYVIFRIYEPLSCVLVSSSINTLFFLLKRGLLSGRWERGRRVLRQEAPPFASLTRSGWVSLTECVRARARLCGAGMVPCVACGVVCSLLLASSVASGELRGEAGRLEGAPLTAACCFFCNRQNCSFHCVAPTHARRRLPLVHCAAP